ncbi:hypothetical protein LSH36_510g02035 [Paralvinella palmiformis]|uniref:Uncharacterized protein n=1 Tax=Paralvinella palmiformis TaxID=53620 RepID=A0AAD9J8F2_9ANNE|nr:hypothetical protein LSH36_510g02035 [Paralvinella palmiformis]
MSGQSLRGQTRFEREGGEGGRFVVVVAAISRARGRRGLSTESPTQSTQGDLSHSQDQHSMRTYIQYMPEPGPSSQGTSRPLSTSTTSSHPAGHYAPQKRASLGLYQHSSPSHQSSRGSPVIVLQSVPSPSPSPIPPTLLMRNGEPSSQSVQSPLDNGAYVR